MTALAILIAAAIVFTAVFLAAGTPDVDSMADPTPRLGEDDSAGPSIEDCIRARAEVLGLDPDEAVAGRVSWRDYPLTSGQEIDSRQPRRSGRAPAEGPVPDSAARPSGPSGSRREPIADSDPHVPPDVMRIIDATSPKDQEDAKRALFMKEGMVQ